MSTLKASFSPEEAMTLLRELYPDAHHLLPVSGGEISRAYVFTTGRRQLVLRGNHHSTYQREAWASRKMRHTSVPAPQVILTGEDESMHWAISERAAGPNLATVSARSLVPLRVQMVKILIAIHKTPIEDTTGFGWLDDNGNASHARWSGFLRSEGTYGSLVDWESALSQAGDHRRCLVEDSWNIALEPVKFCPEERVLNHGDYSLDNIISDSQHITGVVDWSCVVGDRVWDVAWADFWAPDLGFAATYRRAKPTKNFDQHLMCYKLLFAAQAIGFYIPTEQPAKGRWVEDRLLALLRRARKNQESVVQHGHSTCSNTHAMQLPVETMRPRLCHSHTNLMFPVSSIRIIDKRGPLMLWTHRWWIRRAFASDFQVLAPTTVDRGWPDLWWEDA